MINVHLLNAVNRCFFDFRCIRVNINLRRISVGVNKYCFRFNHFPVRYNNAGNISGWRSRAPAFRAVACALLPAIHTIYSITGNLSRYILYSSLQKKPARVTMIRRTDIAHASAAGCLYHREDTYI